MKKLNPKFDLRNHAIEQYNSRKRITCSAKETRAYLIRHINKSAYKLKKRTRTGEEQWHVPSAGCILITKYERGVNVVVTIINDNSIINDINYAEELYLNSLLDVEYNNYKFNEQETGSEITNDKLVELIKTGKTEVIERLSSRTKVHKVIVDNKIIKFTYNTNSKKIGNISEEFV